SRQVTHMFPITHLDMLEAVRRSVAAERDLNVLVAGGQIQAELIITGPALKVRHAVENAAAIDPPPPPPISATIKRTNLDARLAAGQIEEAYRDRPPEQMVRALFDQRTNSVILSGSDVGVLEASMMLRRMDTIPQRIELPEKVEIPERRFAPPPEEQPPA